MATTLMSITDLGASVLCGQACVGNIATISNLITANADAIVTYKQELDGTFAANTEAIKFAILPEDDVFADEEPQVHYLKSRKRALLEVLLAHLSGTIPVDTSTGGSSTGTPLAALYNIRTGLAANIAAATLTPAGQVGNGFVFNNGEVGTATLSGNFGCKQNTIVQPNAASFGTWVCTYSSESNFLLMDESRDELKLRAADKALVDFPEADSTTYTLGTFFDLINDHGEFADLSTVDYASTEWLTVFAPNEAAFIQLDADLPLVKPFLVWNKQYAQAILKQHIVRKVANPTYSEDLAVGDNVLTSLTTKTFTVNKSAGDGGVSVTVQDGGEYDATCKVVTTDLYTQNAVVHTIDRVLLGNADLTLVNDIVAYSKYTDRLDSKKHKTLIDLVDLASDDFKTLLTSDTTYTLIAPVEAAFDKLTAEQKAFLTNKANQAKLDEVLQAHLLKGAHFATGTEYVNPPSDSKFDDVNGVKVKCTDKKCGSAVISSQRYTRYGVVYDAASVIVPAGIFPAVENGVAAIGASALVTLGVAALACVF